MSSTTEIEGVHDTLREAYQAALEDDWDRFNDLMLSARSEGLKYRAELMKRGELEQ